jgi:hypothetical protein
MLHDLAQPSFGSDPLPHLTRAASERSRRHRSRRSRAERHDEWQASDRRYLYEGSMAKLNPTSDTGPVAAIEAGD